MQEHIAALKLLVGDAMKANINQSFEEVADHCQPAVDYAIAHELIMDRTTEFIITPKFMRLLGICITTDAEFAAILAGWAGGVITV